jgi:hypothetical protein
MHIKILIHTQKKEKLCFKNACGFEIKIKLLKIAWENLIENQT